MSMGDPAGQGAPRVCRCLRTKAAFGTVIGESDWRTGESSTNVYWCLATMEHRPPHVLPLDGRRVMERGLGRPRQDGHFRHVITANKNVPLSAYWRQMTPSARAALSVQSGEENPNRTRWTAPSFQRFIA
jgi:hypothetical protein